MKFEILKISGKEKSINYKFEETMEMNGTWTKSRCTYNSDNYTVFQLDYHSNKFIYFIVECDFDGEHYFMRNKQ